MHRVHPVVFILYADEIQALETMVNHLRIGEEADTKSRPFVTPH
jgi:hypothetical protein